MARKSAIGGITMILVMIWLVPNAFVGGLYLATEGQLNYERTQVGHSKIRVGLAIILPTVHSLLFIPPWYYSRNLEWEVSADGMVVSKLGAEPARHELTAILVLENKRGLQIVEENQSFLGQAVLHRLSFVPEERRVDFIEEFEHLRDKKTEPLS